MKVGILALQGDFEAHHRKLLELEVTPFYIKHPYQVSAVSALILPGGESTTMLRLLTAEFKQTLVDAIRSGLPVLATCAGCILLASGVSHPRQESLSLLDIDVTRNAYGRQRESFIERALSWTKIGADLVRELTMEKQESSLEGTFIRAPQITRTGSAVEVLIEYRNSPVLVRQRNILACTFHPELSDTSSTIHKMLTKLS